MAIISFYSCKLYIYTKNKKQKKPFGAFGKKKIVKQIKS